MKLIMQDMYLSGAHEQFLRKRSRSKKMLTEWGVPLASAEVVNKVLNLWILCNGQQVVVFDI